MERSNDFWSARFLTDEDMKIIELLGLSEDEVEAMWQAEEESWHFDMTRD